MVQKTGIFLRSLLQKIIAPPFCHYCRVYLDTYEPLCRSCIQLIKPILSTFFDISPSYRVVVHAISAYEDPLKALILKKVWKEYETSVHLGTLVARYSVIASLPCDYLIPVPLHYSKYVQRGYNQSLVVAQQVSRICNVQVLDCVQRVKKTVNQASCGKAERYHNVYDAFVPASTMNLISGKVVVIIDDLMTSGATLRALAKVLTKSLPKEIYAIVVCRAL